MRDDSHILVDYEARKRDCVAKIRQAEQNREAQTMARIALVDDDRNILTSVSMTLEAEGFEVETYNDGQSALDAFNRRMPDMAVLDIKMPRMDGMDLLQRLRQKSTLPVIFLTSKDDEIDEVLGLRMGADDYVKKPFSQRLLVERIRALLRRHEGSEVQAPSERRRLQFGPLVIDSAMREAWLGEQSIELTSAEFDLLWLLTSNAGRILSREEIFNALRGIEYDGQDRSIDVRISRIRPKIGDDPMHPRLIKTVRSKGYLFVAEAAEALT